MQFIHAIFKANFFKNGSIKFFGLKGMGPKFFMAVVMGREGKGRDGWQYSVKE